MTSFTESPSAAVDTAAPLTAVPLRWQAVQAGLWVGRRDGEFAGMIEQMWGRGFIATTAFGKQLGLFPTIEEAQAALV